MKKLSNLVKKVKKLPRNIALWGAGVGLGAMVATSCAPLTVAQQEALLGSALTVAGTYDLAGKKTKTDRILNEAMVISGAVVSQQAQMRQQLEVAEAGKTDITINNNPPIQQQNKYDSKTSRLGTPIGFFMHTGWRDKVPFENEAHADEYENLNSSVFDIRISNRLCFSFYSNGNPDYEGITGLQVWKMEGDKRKELIVDESSYYDCQKIGESCFTKYKFEENGDYQAILRTPKGNLLKDFYLIIN